MWLEGAEPKELNQLPEVLKRIESVRQFRLKSDAASTRKIAAMPSLFRDRNRFTSCIVVPRVSSENRPYIPCGFFGQNSIVSDTCMSVPNGKLYHFGILMSTMHMTWVRAVCGRLEMRYRYSKDVVYNNFPWPEKPTEKQINKIENAAQKVLEARELFPNSSFADLYNPLTMPEPLVKAHNELDKAVDLAYRSQPFTSETNRMEFLFWLYEQYLNAIFALDKPKKHKTNLVQM